MLANRACLLVVAAALCGCGGTTNAAVGAPASVRVASEGQGESPAVESREASAQLGAQSTARQFWVRLGRRDYAGAAALATYPFDLDGHEGCVGSANELERALADPDDKELVVGRARLIDAQGSGLEPMWAARYIRFSSSGANCLAPHLAQSGAVQYYLVEFTVDGEAVGGLTRVRCRGGDCRVAGVDN